MPLFIKAKTKKILAARTKNCIETDPISCALFSCTTKPKVKTLNGTIPLKMAKRTEDDRMSSASLGSFDGLVADIHQTSKGNRASVVDLLSKFRPIRDSLQTSTSVLQYETMEECLPYLPGADGSQLDETGLKPLHIPRLKREKHLEFLRQSLEKLPAGYVAIDASRPWILYWVLAALSLLGEDVRRYQER